MAGTVPLVDTYSFASFASGDSKEAGQYVSMAEEDPRSLEKQIAASASKTMSRRSGSS